MLDRFAAWAFPGAAHVQNVHPILVNFPIGLLYAATLLYFLAAILRSDSLKWAGLWSLVLGVLGAAASVATGLEASNGVMIAPSVRSALLDYHRDLMIAALALSALLALWALIARPMPVRVRWGFLIAMLVLCGVIAKGADYGARMVFDYNAGGNACGQPIEFSK